MIIRSSKGLLPTPQKKKISLFSPYWPYLKENRKLDLMCG